MKNETDDAIKFYADQGSYQPRREGRYHTAPVFADHGWLAQRAAAQNNSELVQLARRMHNFLRLVMCVPGTGRFRKRAVEIQKQIDEVLGDK